MNHYRFSRIRLVSSLLFILSGCGSTPSATDFPPTEESLKFSTEQLGWTLDADGTQSWSENQIICTLKNDEQTQVSISCASIDGNRILIANCTAAFLPDKPQFTWETWKEVLTLAETLYGNFDEGDLYQSFSEQSIPEPEVSTTNSDAPTWQESLNWEAECPTGYGRARWSISSGTVEHDFPSSAIQDWRTTFSISLYESKDTYERMAANS